MRKKKNNIKLFYCIWIYTSFIPDCCGGSWDDYEVIYEFTFKDSSKAKLIFSSDGYFPADSGKLTLFLLINKEQLKSLTFSELADKLDGSLTEPSTEKELSNFLKPRY